MAYVNVIQNGHLEHESGFITGKRINTFANNLLQQLHAQTLCNVINFIFTQMPCGKVGGLSPLVQQSQNIIKALFCRIETILKW